MGITGLARWSNSTQKDFEVVCHRIRRMGGVSRSGWVLTMRTYRSSLDRGDRIMHTVTTRGVPDPCTYVWLEDGSVPSRGEYRASLSDKPLDEIERSKIAMMQDDVPAHFRTTFITLKPPNSLDMLLEKLRAPWVPGRQAPTQPEAYDRIWMQGKNVVHLVVEGVVFELGDWIVRVGQLSSPTQGPKGMLLEAEYLPLVHMPPREDGDVTKLNEFLSSFLAALFPASPNARRTVAALEENLWVEASAEDIFEGLFTVVESAPTQALSNGVVGQDHATGDTDMTPKPVDSGTAADKPAGNKGDAYGNAGRPEPDAMDEDREEEIELREDDWVYGTDTVPPPDKLDWVGAERERRSAFSIMFVLRRENIL